MAFELIDDIELRTDYYVSTRIRVLDMNKALARQGEPAIIAALMASPFHLLQGDEYPDGFTTNWTWERDGKMVTEELHHVKVFGHYDLNTLTVSDYRGMDRTALEKRFFDFADEITYGDQDYLNDIRTHLSPLLNDEASYYLLDLSPGSHPEKVSEVLNVFTHFIAFLAIDSATGRLILVEFAQD